MKRISWLTLIIFSFISCQKEDPAAEQVRVATGPGPEDIVYDAAHNRVLISCDERREGYPQRGDIWYAPMDEDTSYVLTRVNFPGGKPFHPHGFDLQTVDGELCLYVINHYKDEDHTTMIEKFRVTADHLEYIESFGNPLLISPNDLTVLPDGSFYFSNDQGSNNILDLLNKPKSGSLVYADGHGYYQKVDSVLAFPNGLYNENGRLWLATSRNKALFTYDIQPDGTLANRSVLNTINGMDNIIIHGDELIVAVHSDEVKFALLSLDPTKKSPCKSYAINKHTGFARLIFDDDGTLISGASTTLIAGKDLYMGQVFGDYLLKIRNYSKR